MNDIAVLLSKKWDPNMASSMIATEPAPPVAPICQRVTVASSPHDFSDRVDLVAIHDLFTVLRYPRTGPRLQPNGCMG